ncbi:hypothetical protein, partial [Streptomyces sp. NPDC056549]|uniref:hypothetical protein n=1 Tax=Streptomyces sp. NPDC056549 TaxID=3345864 RepID=UPI0036C74938
MPEVLPGFNVAFFDDIEDEVVTDRITCKTIKPASADDPSVIQMYRMSPGAVAGEDKHFACE